MLLSLVNLAVAADIDVHLNPVEDWNSSGSVGDAEIYIQEEVQVVTALQEVDTQLNQILQSLSRSGSTEIDVVITESTGSGSDQWIDQEIVVQIPSSNLTLTEKNELKEELENEVGAVLDQVILDEVMELPKQVEKSFPDGVEEQDFESGGTLDKVERLYEEEDQAAKELGKMESELKDVLDNLPESGGPTEIDIVVSHSDGEEESEDEEIVIEIPASTGSGPRLTEEEKSELEEAIAADVSDTLGAIIMNDFVGTASPKEDGHAQHLVVDPLLDLERTSAPLPIAQAVAEAIHDDVHPQKQLEPARLRREPTMVAPPGYEHPMFIPHHWQMPPEDQLWTMKLSMLTSISCVTILLIMGVWTQIRRSRRRAVLDDNHFRWAEAVEYMDAFPYDP